MKSVSLLGSTGSIGTQTLDVIRKNNDIKVVALAAGTRVKELAEQAREFKPQLVSVKTQEKAKELKVLLSDMDVKIVYGMEGLIEAATIDEADIVVTAVVGMMGIEPTIAAIMHIKILHWQIRRHLLQPVISSLILQKKKMYQFIL